MCGLKTTNSGMPQVRAVLHACSRTCGRHASSRPHSSAKRVNRSSLGAGRAGLRPCCCGGANPCRCGAKPWRCGAPGGCWCRCGAPGGACCRCGAPACCCCCCRGGAAPCCSRCGGGAPAGCRCGCHCPGTDAPGAGGGGCVCCGGAAPCCGCGMSRCGGACACRCRCCCCWRKARMRSRSCGVGIRSCCEPGSPAGRARSMAGAAVGGRGAATMVCVPPPPHCRRCRCRPATTRRLLAALPSRHTNHPLLLWGRPCAAVVNSGVGHWLLGTIRAGWAVVRCSEHRRANKRQRGRAGGPGAAADHACSCRPKSDLSLKEHLLYSTGYQARSVVEGASRAAPPLRSLAARVPRAACELRTLCRE